MQYVGDTVAVGVVMMNREGFDEMVVFQGTIQETSGSLFLDIPHEEPMKMSQKWLEKLKPVEESMGKEFQGAKHCLVIGALTKNNDS